MKTSENQLFQGESQISTWNGCTLTNKRVFQKIESAGQYSYRSFPLTQLQGAFVGRTTMPWLMYAGIFFLVAGIIGALTSSENRLAPLLSGLVVGGIFLIAWHLTKRAVVIFGSVSFKNEIRIQATKDSFNQALNFVAEVEKAATSANPESTHLAA